MNRLTAIVSMVLCLVAPVAVIAQEKLSSTGNGFEIHDQSKTEGKTTTLKTEFDGPIPRHDATDYGRTTLSLISKKTNSTLLKREFSNAKFVCVGYCSARHAYVLESSGELVSTPGVDSIIYLTETSKPKVLGSAFNSACRAFTALPSTDVRYIVFIGQRGTNEADTDSPPKLYVLDTVADKIHQLGKAPYPPPLDKEFSSDSSQWDWHFSGMRDLEPSVCRFVQPHVLRVTYGKDDFRHRAKHRQIRTWNLDSLSKSTK
jgi:hypothetical protein